MVYNLLQSVSTEENLKSELSMQPTVGLKEKDRHGWFQISIESVHPKCEGTE